MQWIFFAIVPAISLALVNHIDKFLITRFVKGGSIGSLIIFSSLIGIPIFLLIGLFTPNVFSVPPYSALLLIFNGMIYLSYVLPYLYALEKDEASIVVPLFHIAPVISYILGIVFLEEQLTILQFISCFLILGGALLLTLEFERKKIKRLKIKVFLLMFLASLLYAINGLIFKVATIQETFWKSSFWEYIGFLSFGFLLLTFVPSYKKQFFYMIRKNRTFVLSLNLINEVLATIANISLHFATLLSSLALVYVIAEGFQPFFVLIFGIVITMFFPKIGKENIAKRYLLQKLCALVLMVLGTYFLIR